MYKRLSFDYSLKKSMQQNLKNTKNTSIHFYWLGSIA